MLAGKSPNSMDGHVARIAAHGNGSRHLEQENSDPILVPRLVGSSFMRRRRHIHDEPRNAFCWRTVVSSFFRSERTGKEAVLLWMTLKAGGPEVEEDKAKKHEEGDVGIAEVNVNAAGENKRVSAGHRTLARRSYLRCAANIIRTRRTTGIAATRA